MLPRVILTCPRKKLRRDLSTLFPASEQLVPPKCSLVTARLVTHGGSTVAVFMVDGEPLFFDDDGTIFPTGMYHIWTHGEIITRSHPTVTDTWLLSPALSDRRHFLFLPCPPCFHVTLHYRCSSYPNCVQSGFWVYYLFSRVVPFCMHYTMVTLDMLSCDSAL